MARLSKKRPIRDKAPTPFPKRPIKPVRGGRKGSITETPSYMLPSVRKKRRKTPETEVITTIGKGGKERREKVTRTSPKPAPTRPKKPGKPVNRPLPKLSGTAKKRMEKAVSTRSNIRKARRRVKKT